MASDKQMGKRALRKQANAKENDDGSGPNKFYIGAGVLFLFCGLGAIQFAMLVSEMFSGAVVGVQYIRLDQEDQLKQAFFSGEPHVLYCQGDKTEGTMVPQVVTELAKKVAQDKVIGDTKVIAANCFQKMKSGKTIAERFDFGKNEGFIGVFANEDTPKMLNYLRSADHVLKQIKPMLKPTLAKIVYKNDWEETKKRKTFMILGAQKKPMLTNMEMVFQPLVKEFRRVKVVSVDTSFWKVDTSEEFDKLVPTDTDKDYGYAMCVSRIAEEEEANADGTVKEVPANAPKKPKYQAAYLKSWDGDAPRDFMIQCNNGGEPEWTKLMRKVKVYARPSEAKVVKAPPRPGQENSEGAGLKKGGKEKIGRREEETIEDDGEDDDMAEAAEDEVVEDVEL